MGGMLGLGFLVLARVICADFWGMGAFVLAGLCYQFVLQGVGGMWVLGLVADSRFML